MEEVGRKGTLLAAGALPRSRVPLEPFCELIFGDFTGGETPESDHSIFF
jgi:hypothetical protein